MRLFGFIKDKCLSCAVRNLNHVMLQDALSSPALLLLVVVPPTSSTRLPVRECLQQKGFHRLPALDGVLQKVLPAANATFTQ